MAQKCRVACCMRPQFNICETVATVTGVLGAWCSVCVDAPPSGRSSYPDSEVAVTCVVLHKANQRATAVYLFYAPWSVSMLNALLAVIPKACSWEFAYAHGLSALTQGLQCGTQRNCAASGGMSCCVGRGPNFDSLLGFELKVYAALGAAWWGGCCCFPITM